MCLDVFYCLHYEMSLSLFADYDKISFICDVLTCSIILTVTIRFFVHKSQHFFSAANNLSKFLVSTAARSFLLLYVPSLFRVSNSFLRLLSWLSSCMFIFITILLLLSWASNVPHEKAFHTRCLQIAFNQVFLRYVSLSCNLYLNPCAFCNFFFSVLSQSSWLKPRFPISISNNIFFLNSFASQLPEHEWEYLKRVVRYIHLLHFIRPFISCDALFLQFYLKDLLQGDENCISERVRL